MADKPCRNRSHSLQDFMEPVLFAQTTFRFEDNLIGVALDHLFKS